MSERTACPSCGNQYKSPANHWASSSSCDFPDLTGRQQAITAGLLLAGGQLSAASRNYALSLTSTRKAFLEWLDDEFGIHGKGEVYHVDDGDGAESRFSDLSSTSEMDTSDIYEWVSRTNPAFNRYSAEWFDDEGNRSPPSELTADERTLRVWYANRGSLREETGTTWATLRTPDDFDDEWLRTFLAPYSPRITHTKTGLNRVMLRRSDVFFDHIGWESVPGCEDRWPDDSVQLSTVDGALYTCPSCGGDFESLGSHWARDATDCPPDLSTSQRSVVEGVLAVRGRLSEQMGDQGGSYLVLRSTNRELLEWVGDELGWLTRGISGAEFESEQPEQWADGEFEELYELRTHSHPKLGEMRHEWYTADGEKQAPIGTLKPTSTLLRAMYVVAGNTRQRDGQDRNSPAVSITRSSAPDHEWTTLFKKFDPSIHRTGSRRLVHLRDTDSFLDFIGTAPNAFESKWL